jgi:hypothetical protein
MNDTVAATVTLIFISAVFYGCWKLIESQEETYRDRQKKYEDLVERFVVAVEKAAERQAK